MPSFREGEILLDTYQILSFLGKGTFGEVYKVRVLRGRYAGRVLALKVATDPETVEFLRREVQTLLLFNHPHIISMISYMYRKDRNELYVLYELMDVGDLKDYVQRKGRLSEEEALGVLFHVAKGLDYLHTRGYIHGDVKPQNIFGKRVMKNILWKLGDFGLVRVRGSQTVLDVKGTVGYIAPEVFRNELRRSSDIFSLGCVLLFMLTGETPFGGDIKKNKAVEYSIPQHVSERTQRLLTKMLEPDPSKRFKTAGELIEYLIKERMV
ncbi:serine/threonine protein kinase [Thermocrinis albus DSM 14484]|uniref:Serine/threonine protein kinase n=1 Tax=Thermocrinis albus (strain DSM 14484 / JCM 11386 / HI 11/12) TaxID=638303 RepID=D3SMS8_THEAH|nr:serine/threonine-protein kinase [Thermocrinis albus]ADC90058.1 serine/threonine protein kinase [Thermocrinis albus DSM 14484]